MIRFLFAAFILFSAQSARALDPLCVPTPNLSIPKCPANSEDWFDSYTSIVDNLDTIGGLTQASTVTVNAPILGDGSTGDPLSLDSSSVTLQGNQFNNANQLVLLDGTTKYPALDGSAITNITAFVVRSSSEQDAGVDIAFTDLVSISTTAITFSGERFGLLLVSISIQNDAGGARDYEFQVDRGVTTILGPFTFTIEGNSSLTITNHKFQDPTPTGLTNYILHGKSSSGAGTQTVIASRLSVIEW